MAAPEATPLSTPSHPHRVGSPLSCRPRPPPPGRSSPGGGPRTLHRAPETETHPRFSEVHSARDQTHQARADQNCRCESHTAKAPACCSDGRARAVHARLTTNPRTADDRRHLLDRLVAAISRKLEQLEHRMALDLDDAATATDHDRESRAIGALIDNLGKITEMETGLARTSGKSDATDIAGDADRWRRELAGRLAKIVGPAPGVA